MSSAMRQGAVKERYSSPVLTAISLDSLCKIEAAMDYCSDRTNCSCGGNRACGNDCYCTTPAKTFRNLTGGKISRQSVYDTLATRYDKDAQWSHLYSGTSGTDQAHCWEQAGFSATDKSQVLKAYTTTIYDGSYTCTNSSTGLYESTCIYSFGDYTLKLWGSWIWTSSATSIKGSDAYITNVLVGGKWVNATEFFFGGSAQSESGSVQVAALVDAMSDASSATDFSLRILDLQAPLLSDGYSSFAVMRTVVTIGSETRVGQAEAPGAMLLLLATLSDDHEVSAKWPLLPSSASIVGDVAIPGLLSDDELDWSVTHDGNDVVLDGFGSEPVRIALAEYREQVCAYAQSYRDFWDEHIAGKEFADWEKEEWGLYWRKWDELLQAAPGDVEQ